MSIKFICSCGKHLRARDEMAGRRSVCPQCGMPVGIPFLDPTHPGGTGHMTPAERLRHQRRVRSVESLFSGNSPGQPANAEPQASAPATNRPVTLSEELFPRPLDPTLVRLVGNPGQRSWKLETRWYQCLLYPLRAWWLIMPLAAVLSLLTAGTMFFLPEILKLRDKPVVMGLLALPYFGLIGLILSYAASVPEGALISGCGGEFRHIHWPGRSVLQAVRSFVVWLLCFVTGPLLFMFSSLVYWIHCGDPGFLDWFILVELNIVGVTFALLTLLSFCRRERLSDVNPWQVALLIHRIDYRVLGMVFLTSALLLAHGIVVIVAVSRFQQDAASAWLLLTAIWLSGLFCTTFLLRLVGVWCYRAGI